MAATTEDYDWTPLRIAVTGAMVELEWIFQVVAPRVENGPKEWALSFKEETGVANVQLFVQPDYLFAFSYPLSAGVPLPDARILLSGMLGLPLAKFSLEEDQLIVWGQIPTDSINAATVKNLVTAVLQGGNLARKAAAPQQATSAGKR